MQSKLTGSKNKNLRICRNCKKHVYRWERVCKNCKVNIRGRFFESNKEKLRIKIRKEKLLVKRNEKILFMLRKKQYTLEKIGNIFGLTRERVRQIYYKHAGNGYKRNINIL